MYERLDDPNAVRSAVAEFDRLGRDAFLALYGFRPAKRYFLVVGQRRYDSKAIVAAAFGFQFGKALGAAQFSGGKLTVKRKLESLGFEVIDACDFVPLAEETSDDALWEGATDSVRVNRYERSRKARAQCVKALGKACVVCGFDFGQVYGVELDGYIHVHHVVPLAGAAERRKVVPAKDLVPICPNCHAAVHFGGRTRTIAEVKALLGAPGRSMTHVALVSCAKSKRDAPSPASELYTSALFRGMRRYAERHADVWFILSAEHGLLHPDDVVAPYERTLVRMSASDRAAWLSRVTLRLQRELPKNARVTLLAGQHYRRGLEDFLRARGHDVQVPMRGLKLGEQLRFLGWK